MRQKPTLPDAAAPASASRATKSDDTNPFAGLTPEQILKKAMANSKALEAALCLQSFEAFVLRAWSQIDTSELLWGWHMSALCLHLQAMAEGKIRRLIINIPPGHAKSMIVSVLYPAWMWARNPKWQSLQCAYKDDLCMRDAVRSRTLMETEWFKTMFRSGLNRQAKWGMSEDENNKGRYVNTERGARTCVAVGTGTGFRGDHIGIDDPLNAEDAMSESAREKVKRWYRTTVATRFNKPTEGTICVIMQRLHEDDLVGWLLTKKNNGFVHLNLATEFESARKCVTPIWSDPRVNEGDLLFPELFTREAIADIKETQGEWVYAAQHQQRPIPEGGGLVKAEWFRNRWDVLPDFEAQNMYVDAAFRKTNTSDLVAIGVFGKKGPNLYLIDLVWERLTFTETCAAIKRLKHKWPRTAGVYVEDKANGDAIIDTLQSQIPGVNPIKPEGGKEARISAITPLLQAGNLWLPSAAAWVDKYIAEACSFPNAPHDDAIDMTAHGINHMLLKNRLNRFLALANG